MSAKSKGLWWRIPLGAIGVLVVLVAVALGVGLSDYGLNFIRPRALKALNEDIRGHVDLARIRRNGMHLTLDGVVVKDPEGRTAATIERIVVHPTLRPLLRGEMILRTVALTKPHLNLHTSPDGLNLARAFEPRKAKPPKKDEPASDKPMHAAIESLRVHDGQIRYEAPKQKPELVDVRNLNVAGRADVLWPGGPITIDLDANAKVLEPIAAPFSFSFAMAPHQGATHTVRLKTALEKSGVALAGTFVPNLRSPTIDVQLERGELSPALANALMPGSPLITPFNLTGHIAGELRDMKAGQAAVDLNLATQGGTFNVVASANSEPVLHGEANIKSDPLDLSRIVRGAAKSRLPLRLAVQARGTTLGKITGKMSASLLPGHIAGLKTGPLEIAASMQNERATIDVFDVSLPGLDVKATGQVQGVGTLLPRGQVSVNVGVVNFETFARAIAATGAPAPDLGGAGNLQVNVQGNPLALNARVEGRFSSLRVGTTRVQGLHVKGSVPSLLRPWLPELHVTAARIDAGTLLLGVGVDVRPSADDRLAIDVRTRAPVPASAKATIKWREPGRSFLLEKLWLDYPATQWRSEGPAEIVLAPTLRVGHVALRADTQRLAVDLALAQKSVNAKLRIANLDLKRLGALVGPGFPAAGKVSVQLDANGQLPLPRAKLSLQMQEAAFGAYGPFVGDVTVAHEASRASGQLSVAGAGATVSGKFNVPAMWPWPARIPAQIEINAAVPSVQEAVQRLGLKLPLQPQGALTLDLNFQGRQQRPVLQFEFHGKGLKLDDIKVGDANIRISDDGKTPLAAAMTLANSAMAKSVAINLDTRLSVADLLRQKPAQIVAAARTKPLRLQATVASLDLQQVTAAAARLSPPKPGKVMALQIAGFVDMKADLAGTVGAPDGTVNVKLTGGKMDNWPATDATLALALAPQEVKVDARAYQKGRNGKRIELLSLDASANVPAQARLRPEAWQQAKFGVKANVGPLAFQHLAVPGESLGSLRGQIHARLNAHGTILHPQIALDVEAAKVQTQAGKLGDAALHVRYEKDIPAIDLAIKPPDGGTLTLAARTQAPLPWLQAAYPGWKPSLVPVDIKFASQRFNLGGFNGAVKTIREIQGTLDGNLHFAGTLDKPDFSGNMKLAKGELDLVEVGRFFDIGMDLQATEDMVKLDALRFKSGKGEGVVRFEAKRTESRGLALTGNVKLDRFPLQSPQRKLGEVFLRASAKGQVNADGLTILPLKIDEAKAFLEGDSPKKLQSLDFPDDIVMVRNGQPLDDDEERKFASLGPPAPLGAPTNSGKRKLIPSPSSMPIVVHVKAPRNVWVYAPEGNIELGLSDDFQVRVDDEIRVYGTVFLRRGDLSVLGKGFELESGSTVRFTGSSEQPVLDVTLHHKIDQKTQIDITLKGTPENLTIKFRAETAGGVPMSETEIISMLVTGKNADGIGNPETGRGQQAASIVGGLIGARLRETLMRKLPIDVLSIATTAIEAGTYITSNLYVGYLRRLTSNPWRYENVNAVHLEYQISKGWSFEGEYGDAGSGSGDLIWKNRY